jgi:hypothetical protein
MAACESHREMIFASREQQVSQRGFYNSRREPSPSWSAFS